MKKLLAKAILAVCWVLERAIDLFVSFLDALFDRHLSVLVFIIGLLLIAVNTTATNLLGAVLVGGAIAYWTTLASDWAKTTLKGE